MRYHTTVNWCCKETDKHGQGWPSVLKVSPDASRQWDKYSQGDVLHDVNVLCSIYLLCEWEQVYIHSPYIVSVMYTYIYMNSVHNTYIYIYNIIIYTPISIQREREGERECIFWCVPSPSPRDWLRSLQVFMLLSGRPPYVTSMGHERLRSLDKRWSVSFDSVSLCPFS